jgi:hypothetical protein
VGFPRGEVEQVLADVFGRPVRAADDDGDHGRNYGVPGKNPTMPRW